MKIPVFQEASETARLNTAFYAKMGKNINVNTDRLQGIASDTFIGCKIPISVQIKVALKNVHPLFQCKPYSNKKCLASQTIFIGASRCSSDLNENIFMKN